MNTLHDLIRDVTQNSDHMSHSIDDAPPFGSDHRTTSRMPPHTTPYTTDSFSFRCWRHRTRSAGCGPLTRPVGQYDVERPRAVGGRAVSSSQARRTGGVLEPSKRDGAQAHSRRCGRVTRSFDASVLYDHATHGSLHRCSSAVQWRKSSPVRKRSPQHGLYISVRNVKGRPLAIASARLNVRRAHASIPHASSACRAGFNIGKGTRSRQEIHCCFNGQFGSNTQHFANTCTVPSGTYLLGQSREFG